MAINPSDLWPSRTEAPDADYPYGGAKDETSPDAFDGTPFERSLLNDTWGFYQALLSQAGITPSGNPDTAQASQYLEALTAAARHALSFERVVVGSLGGSFEDAGTVAIFQRVAGLITVQLRNPGSNVVSGNWGSLSSVSSATGVVPERFRPNDSGFAGSGARSPYRIYYSSTYQHNVMQVLEVSGSGRLTLFSYLLSTGDTEPQNNYGIPVTQYLAKESEL